MKFTLTISDASAADIAKIMSSVSGAAVTSNATPPVISGTFTPQLAQENDEDNAPLNTAAPATDSAGHPWDERIHSANKGLNKDGTWRAKRGVAAELVKQVEAELQARQSQAPQWHSQPQQVPAGMPQQPVNLFPAGAPNMQPPVMQAQPQFQQPAMPTMAQQPTPQAQPQQTGALDFNAFMGVVSKGTAMRDASGNPSIDMNYLNRICGEIGQAFNCQLGSITDIAANPAMINYAAQLLQRDGKWFA